MRLEIIKSRVEGIPYMSISQAKEMTAFILENKLQSILELGFCHGVSTCYMAGALDEMGGGNITTIDLLRARDLDPNIEMLLSDLGLSELVTPFYEPTSYIWRLMKMIEADPTPRFDMCYIAGAHN
jgi:predicted O-methyltransferase YrrM